MFIGDVLKIISFILKLLHSVITLSCCLFVALIVYLSTIQPSSIPLLSGQPESVYKEDHQIIHELFPKSNWDDLTPCGAYFNEQEEYNKALQCVNEKVYPDNHISNKTIPRCFVVKSTSPDVYFKENMGFNFIPIISPYGIGAVVGVYQPETKTVFLIENVDVKNIYRHELQHFFLHIHVEGSDGGGHNQEIWNKCEPPYYEPSDEVRKRVLEKSKLTKIEKDKLEKQESK